MEYEPPAHDDLDDPRQRRTRRVTDDRAIIRMIRQTLEDEQVPPERRKKLAREMHDDWTLTESTSLDQWMTRCHAQAKAALGNGENTPSED